MSDFIGIDLGTSNCAIARVGDTGHPENLPITQAITASSEGEKSLLPSAIYLPAEGEFPESSSRQILGVFARERGALQPDRLIVSAKSWLCHPHADRRGPILPWGSATVDHKISPLDASRDLLAHLLESLKNSHPNLAPTHPVITVPASFDEVARGLTLEAAQLAGIPEATLLEEPQAAFYAWFENQGADWRKQVQSGDLLLVCDVGGGTADFSLIAVTVIAVVIAVVVAVVVVVVGVARRV